MPKIRYERIIKAQQNKVFEIATDYTAFQRVLPQYFPSVHIRSSRGNTTVIEQHVVLDNKELVMMTKHVTTYPALHEIFVIGGDAKGTHITERYYSVLKDTKVVLTADIKLQGALRVANFFKRFNIQRDLPIITDEFARLAENLV